MPNVWNGAPQGRSTRPRRLHLRLEMAVKDLLLRLAQWRTTASGLAITGVLVYLWNSFECKIPSDWTAWVAVALPAILGLLARDK